MSTLTIYLNNWVADLLLESKKFLEELGCTMRKLILSVIGLTLFTGCFATIGTSGVVTVPPDAARVCKRHCATIGLELGAVAIMANNVGCICQPKNAIASQPASTAAGMATIMLQEQQRRESQNRNNQH